MKKNLMSVIILALVLADLILTAILAFTMIPQVKKSNELVDQVCAAINIELEGGQNVDMAKVPIEDIEVYSIEDQFMVNLKDDENGRHVAMFSVGLSLNTKSEGYKTYKGSEGLAEKKDIICDQINSIVGSKTVDEFKADSQKQVKEEILTALQSLFGGKDFIVGVNFSSVAAE